MLFMSAQQQQTTQKQTHKQTNKQNKTHAKPQNPTKQKANKNKNIPSQTLAEIHFFFLPVKRLHSVLLKQKQTNKKPTQLCLNVL